MASYFVYILQSDNNRHYIGYTSNLKQRISQHNRKHKGFTGTKEKWEILMSYELADKKSAMELEKYLKSLKNSEKAINYLKKYMVQSTPAKSRKLIFRPHLCCLNKPNIFYPILLYYHSTSLSKSSLHPL